MDNNKFSKKPVELREERSEAQNNIIAFPESSDSEHSKTIEKIEEVAGQGPDTFRSEGGNSRENVIRMEMPPGEEEKISESESDKANAEIRRFGDNGKFGNGNFSEMKKIVTKACFDPHGFSDAVQELSDEISGNLKKVA